MRNLIYKIAGQRLDAIEDNAGIGIKLTTENQDRFQYITERVESVLQNENAECFREFRMEIDTDMMSINGLFFIFHRLFVHFFSHFRASITYYKTFTYLCYLFYKDAC